MLTTTTQGPDSFYVPDLETARSIKKDQLAPEGDFAAIPDLLSERLLQRLDPLGKTPEVIVDLGCDSVARLTQLRERYPHALIVGIGWSENNLPVTTDRLSRQGKKQSAGASSGAGPGTTSLGRKLFGWLPGLNVSRHSQELLVAAAPMVMPLADNSVDMVIASQLLPWCANPAAVFSEAHRVLKTEGAFFWSSAGPDTLKEYRELWRSLDSYPHVWGLRDMHDLGDEMLRCGFDSPVLDRENLTLQYPGVEALAAELRANGLANIAAGRRRGLMARDVMQRLEGLCGKQRFDVTFELVQGHGWKKPVQRRQKPNDYNEVTIPADSIKKRIYNQQRIKLPADTLLPI